MSRLLDHPALFFKTQRQEKVPPGSILRHILLPASGLRVVWHDPCTFSARSVRKGNFLGASISRRIVNGWKESRNSWPGRRPTTTSPLITIVSIYGHTLRPFGDASRVVRSVPS